MMLSRRRFVQGAGALGVGLMVGCGRLPFQAPQQVKVARIGFLTGGNATSPILAIRDAFREGLQELGYVEGQNITIERRYAEGQLSQLPALASDLVTLPVDVIVTLGTFTGEAARDATSTIPIVIVYPGDPVANGLVASFARPGGNITGVTELGPQLNSKKLQLLKEVVPGLSRVALIRDPDLVTRPPTGVLRLADAAEALGVQLHSLDAREPADLDAGFEAASLERVDAVFLGGGRNYRSPEFRSRVVALAAQYGLPAMYGFVEWAEAGGPMAYAPSYPALVRRAPYYVDRILKGTSPADLPVEQPREFEFVINLRTAQALGLTIPQHVLLQATEIIQ
jgi:putative tryptophan/tyrosine transport system substrate-binding protein